MKKIYNLEQLVRIEIKDKQVCQSLEYKPFKKRFWGDRKEGFYDSASFCHYTKEHIETKGYYGEKLFVIDNVVYYSPYVRLTFTGNVGRVREFKTYDEALAWGEEISKSINLELIETD